MELTEDGSPEILSVGSRLYVKPSSKHTGNLGAIHSSQALQASLRASGVVKPPHPKQL